jgi:hypothetical protein
MVTAQTAPQNIDMVSVAQKNNLTDDCLDSFV